MQHDTEHGNDQESASVPDLNLPKNWQDFPRIREEFYLLCMLRFGMDALRYPDDFHEFGRFRREVYPDYFDNNEVPAMDLRGFMRWCADKRSKVQP